MNDWYERAKVKLEAGKAAGSFDRYASVMKNAVCEALDGFCRQDGEFAQAVVQGGSFGDCMAAVAKNCGNAISDLEAFRRAVRFYFPGAGVKFRMELNLCADVEAEDDPEPEITETTAAKTSGKAYPKILDLEDFL